MAGQSHGASVFVGADRLEPGDPVAPFTLPDIDGRPVSPAADRLAGRPLLLLFECAGAPAAAEPGFTEELAALGARAAALARDDVVVLALTRRSREANRTLAGELALAFPLLADPQARVYAACGLDPVTVGRSAVTMVLDRNLRVVGLIDGGGKTRWRPIAAALAAAAAPEPAGTLALQAPVLVLPRVLTPEDCERLVEVWHRPVSEWESDGFETDGFDEADGDFKVRHEGYGKMVQLVVRDAQLQSYLDAKLRRRVLPEIVKAFQTKVSQREPYRIACYDAANDGSVGAHRDNPTPKTRHRRFTMTVALNTGAFKGGGLRFREYSRRGYVVPTGTAIVWSCNLLHEVLPVTSGRRFILGTHLFGN